MTVWLYPVSGTSGYVFEDGDGRERTTSYEEIAESVASGSFPDEAWWPCAQNALHVRAGDELLLYTGERDIGIFAAGRVVGTERRPDGAWLLGWELDAGRTRALLDRPVPAAKVRKHVHPRVTVRDFSAGAKALRKSLA